MFNYPTRFDKIKLCLQDTEAMCIEQKLCSLNKWNDIFRSKCMSLWNWGFVCSLGIILINACLNEAQFSHTKNPHAHSAYIT